VWRLAVVTDSPGDKHKTVGFGLAWRLAVRMVAPGGVYNVSGFLGAWRLAVRIPHQAIWKRAALSAT